MVILLYYSCTFQRYHSEELVHSMLERILQDPKEFQETTISVWKVLKSIAACEHLNLVKARDAASILLDNNFFRPGKVSTVILFIRSKLSAECLKV